MAYVKTYRIEEIKKYDKRPGLEGSFVHGDSMSLTHWKMQKNAVLMEHSHHQEQITFVVSGKIRFERQGQTPMIVEAGGFAVFPSNEPAWRDRAGGHGRSRRLLSDAGRFQTGDVGTGIKPRKQATGKGAGVSSRLPYVYIKGLD